MHEALNPHQETLRGAARKEPLGLYLHVPFCVDRCAYCSFLSTRKLDLKPAFLKRMENDLRAWGEAMDHAELGTLYLGGGTPSVLSAEELARVMETVRSSFDCSNLMEATIEANPGTVDQAWMESARSLGFDRISLGVQSLDGGMLARMGRVHDPRQAMGALEDAARAAFRRVSADLMVGVPGQDLDRVQRDAQALVRAGATHLSIYMLDLDKDCSMKREVEAGRLALPSDDAVADAFEALLLELPKLGMPQYEISNFAVPGQEALHNLRYWQRLPYLGLGPSAASQMANLRWTEAHEIAAWIAGTSGMEIHELSPAEELAEIPMLGLRMREGVDWEALRSRAKSVGLPHLVEGWEKELESFLAHGLLLREGDRLRLSQKGMLLSNAVLQVFASLT